MGERWVVKVGSAVLAEPAAPAGTVIENLVAEIAALCRDGRQLVLVSSGAVAWGVRALGLDGRPRPVQLLQAAAAVGQMDLVREYQRHFGSWELQAAQVLLTHEDLKSRGRYLNARNCLNTLIDLGVIPLVNENDTVATEEIRFGDNDVLAGMVANLVEADHLAILTDQPGLFDADPRLNPDARLVRKVEVDDSSLDAMAAPRTGALGRGGMLTKLSAARQAAKGGADCFIISGMERGTLLRCAEGQCDGTHLYSRRHRLPARKQWLAAQVQLAGAVTLDRGAVDAIRGGGRSLLPIGVTHCEGTFERGALIACLDPESREVARGLANFSAEELAAVQGHSAARFAEILGYPADEELIHRDNLVLV